MRILYYFFLEHSYVIIPEEVEKYIFRKSWLIYIFCFLAYFTLTNQAGKLAEIMVSLAILVITYAFARLTSVIGIFFLEEIENFKKDPGTKKPLR